MPYGHPVIPGKLMNDPITTESPDATVLFAAEWTGRRVIHAMVVNGSCRLEYPKQTEHPALGLD